MIKEKWVAAGYASGKLANYLYRNVLYVKNAHDK